MGCEVGGATGAPGVSDVPQRPQNLGLPSSCEPQFGQVAVPSPVPGTEHLYKVAWLHIGGRSNSASASETTGDPRGPAGTPAAWAIVPAAWQSILIATPSQVRENRPGRPWARSPLAACVTLSNTRIIHSSGAANLVQPPRAAEDDSPRHLRT